MIELSKQFRFDSAHTLERVLDTEYSRRIHGHSYRAEITLRGEPDLQSGMLMDLGLFEKTLEEARTSLDHHLLDDIKGLGPATMENLSVFIWKKLAPNLPKLYKVTVYRDSDASRCVYRGPLDIA